MLSGTRHASLARCVPWPPPTSLLPIEYSLLLALSWPPLSHLFSPSFRSLSQLSSPSRPPDPPPLRCPSPAPLAPPFLRRTDRMEQRDFFSVGLTTLARYTGNDSSWTVDRLITETCSTAFASFHATSSVCIPFLPSLAHAAKI